MLFFWMAETAKQACHKIHDPTLSLGVGMTPDMNMLQIQLFNSLFSVLAQRLHSKCVTVLKCFLLRFILIPSLCAEIVFAIIFSQRSINPVPKLVIAKILKP